MPEAAMLSKSYKSIGKNGRLYLLGGIVLVAAGAGVILSQPAVRRKLRGMPIAEWLAPVFPDLARYIRISSM